MMIKRLLVYTLPAALLLPMPAMQAAQNTNIFSADVRGRSVGINLNPNLTQQSSYGVRIQPLIGISSVSWYVAGNNGLQENFQVAGVNGARRPWLGAATSCKNFPFSPLCAQGARSHTPLAVTFGGAPQTASMKVALGGVQAEFLRFTTAPAVIVATQNTQGAVSFGSFAQTGNATIASTPQARELFNGNASVNRELVSERESAGAVLPVPPVMVPVISLGSVYLWARSNDGKSSIRSCLINQAGLPDLASCTSMPTDAVYRSGAVTPNADATVWVNDVGALEYYRIESDSTLAPERRELNIVIASGGERESAESAASEERLSISSVSFEANPSASRYAAASLGELSTQTASDESSVSMILTASSTGGMYQCRVPRVAASGEVSTSCDELRLDYSGSLEGMVQPIFLRPGLFVTAVNNEAIACQEQLREGTSFERLDYKCQSIVAAAAKITTLSSSINAAQPSYALASEGQSLSIEYDILMGFAEEGTTYGTSLMVAGLQFDAADGAFERASLTEVPGFTQPVVGLRTF